MKVFGWLAAGIMAATAVGAAAQAAATDSPVSAVANSTPWNFGVVTQGGVGLQDRTDFSFFMVGVHAGKVLTPELGKGVLRGNFEYGVEVYPLWQSYTPKFQRILCPSGATSAAQCSAPYTVGGTFTGWSVNPFIFRWNLTHGRKVMPWVQASGGVIWTSDKYPAVGNTNYQDPTQTTAAANTSQWNFSPQGGVGMHYFLRPRRSLDLGLNVVHISSASIGDKNPGVNSSLWFSAGYSWWK